MGDYFRRHSLQITVVVLLITSCQLMSLSIKDASFARMGGKFFLALIAPVQSLSHELYLSSREAWRHYVWLQGVETERNELVLRVKALEAQNSQLIEYKSENERLRTLLNYSERSLLKPIAGTVIGREASNWAKTVTIDRGSVDGIVQGSPVVDGNAVVGQTIVVNDHRSKVLLLNDDTSAIDALIQNSRAQGVVEGLSEGKLRLRYVSKDIPVSVGERVIASGLDAVYPKGTLIGVVSKVEEKRDGLFHYIEVRPSANLDRLENVLILTPAPAVREGS